MQLKHIINSFLLIKNVLKENFQVKPMRSSETHEGFFSVLEKIVRAHPLIYIILGNCAFTNIFEKDFDGLKLLQIDRNKLNIIDVGASDGIASKFFNNNLNVGTIYCYEPNEYFLKILKK